MKKDLHVVACLESPERADTIIACARHCAERLNHKGIILLNVSESGESRWIEQYGLPYVGLKGDWRTAIAGLPTAFGGILAVTAVDPAASRRSIAHPATLLRTFADCKTAYLCVPPSWHNDGGAWPRTAVFTVDHLRESKEKLIWASYFARFFGSKLTAACPTYRDDGLRTRQTNNLRFMRKFFATLEVQRADAPIAHRHFAPADLTALATLEPDILIALTTDAREKDLGDLLAGAPERRLLSQAGGTPILFLNNRDDLYVLCD